MRSLKSILSGRGWVEQVGVFLPSFVMAVGCWARLVRLEASDIHGGCVTRVGSTVLVFSRPSGAIGAISAFQIIFCLSIQVFRFTLGYGLFLGGVESLMGLVVSSASELSLVG